MSRCSGDGSHKPPLGSFRNPSAGWLVAGGCLATGGRSLSLGSRLQPAQLHPVRPPAPQINYGPQQDTTLHQRQQSTPSSHINAQSRATSGNIIETEACRNLWFTSAAKQGVLMCCHICNYLRFSSGFPTFCVGEASVCEGECPRIRDVQLSDYH